MRMLCDRVYGPVSENAKSDMSKDNILMDIFSTVIYQGCVKVASMRVQAVFDGLGFKKSFMSLLSPLFLLTRITKAVTKIPKEHASTVESPNRLFWGKGIR
jgi:hypothetical protein